MSDVAMYGCNRDLRDARDYLWLPSPDDIQNLPSKVNLSEFMPPVLNQGQAGSCTAHGVTEALRFIIKKAGEEDRNLARLQLYYDSRASESTPKKDMTRVDSGAAIRDVIKCTREIGVARENLWPYDLNRLKVKPPDNVYADAHQFESITYQRVTVDPIHIKAAIATKYPVVVGMTLFQSFESLDVARTGIVPMPNLNTERPVGGHCMLAYAYGDYPGYITTRNSWGPQWGNKGDCYIPEHYIGSTLFAADFWRVTRTT